MRLLRLIRSIAPQTGGPAESVLRSTEAIIEEGHEVEIATLDEPGRLVAQSGRAPVHVLGPVLRNYGYSRALPEWLRANVGRFDAVIVSGLWQYHSATAWRVLPKGGVPYFLFPHGMLDPWFRRAHPIKHLKKLAYWFAIERRVLRDAAAVLFTCEEERLLARKTFPGYVCREKVVSYGTAVPELREQREEFLAAFRECRDRRVILFLGRIDRKKGCDILISAFHQFVANAAGEWQLVLAGPDALGWRKELEQLAEDLGIRARVTFTGLLQDRLKWGAFQAAELFALPSHQENFGIAIAEALGCGLPVVISRGVNIWREIETDQAGWVAGADAGQFAAQFARWAKLDPAERAIARERARACFLRRFEIRAAARSLVETVHSCLPPSTDASGKLRASYA